MEEKETESESSFENVNSGLGPEDEEVHLDEEDWICFEHIISKIRNNSQSEQSSQENHPDLLDPPQSKAESVMNG